MTLILIVRLSYYSSSSRYSQGKYPGSSTFTEVIIKNITNQLLIQRLQWSPLLPPGYNSAASAAAAKQMLKQANSSGSASSDSNSARKNKSI